MHTSLLPKYETLSSRVLRHLHLHPGDANMFGLMTEALILAFVYFAPFMSLVAFANPGSHQYHEPRFYVYLASVICVFVKTSIGWRVDLFLLRRIDLGTEEGRKRFTTYKQWTNAAVYIHSHGIAFAVSRIIPPECQGQSAS